MAQKFYVVWVGRKTGIFTDWTSCKMQIDKFAGAKYKSFDSFNAADRAFRSEAPPTAAASTSSASKTASSSSPKTHNAAEVAALVADVKIFTDGGCDPNPGKAGSGLALYRNEVLAELWYGLFNPRGTNNTAELNAFHQALLMAQSEIASGKSVAIFCDSKYAIQCITQWAIGWKKKGWTKPGGEIKNLELIQEMFALHQLIKDQVKVWPTVCRSWQFVVKQWLFCAMKKSWIFGKFWQCKRAKFLSCPLALPTLLDVTDPLYFFVP